MTMPEEEKMILHWIMQYEVMTLEQATQLLHHKNRSTAQKIIRGLKKQHKISYINGGVYIGAYPCSKPDPKIIDAIWILIQYADVIEQYQHHAMDELLQYCPECGPAFLWPLFLPQ